MADNKNSKEITIELAGIQKDRIDNCQGCGGSGKVYRDEDGDLCEKLSPFVRAEYWCPDCALIRELDLCWHDKVLSQFGGTVECPDCGKQVSGALETPDLTQAPHGSTLLIVHWMKVLGVYGDFVAWHSDELDIFCINMEDRDWDIGYSPLRTRELADLASADILTDGEHLVPAVHSWLKERG